MLREKFRSADKIGKIDGRKIFHPASDRDFWEKVKKNSGGFFEEYYKTFENKTREHLTASLYREFKTNGNRTRYESIYFTRRAELVNKVILECIHNNGEYIEDILDLTWMVLEETSWCLPAHEFYTKEADTLPGFEKQTLDLFAAETMCIMAFIYITVGEKLDELSKVVTRRIKYRVNRILDDYLERNDYWWMGFTGELLNNWNVWINSNIIASSSVLCDNNDKLSKIIFKAICSVDLYIDNLPFDGACDEGMTYWGQSCLSMVDCLWLLFEISNGKINFLGEGKVKNALRYPMKMYIGDGECICFADGSNKSSCCYPTLYKLAKKIGDRESMAFAGRLFAENDKPVDVRTINPAGMVQTLRILDKAEFCEEFANTDTEGICGDIDYYLPSISVMTSKSYFDNTDGLIISAKGGHNGESHNHNDMGQFVVYKNSVPFIIDSGSETYSAITFSDKRYTLWTTRSAYHNVPLIDGKEQKEGKEYFAEVLDYSKDGHRVCFSIDLKNAYINREEINEWNRTFEFDRKNQTINVTEKISFIREMPYELHFLTPQKPQETEYGFLLNAKNGEKLEFTYNKEALEFDFEEIMVTDEKIKSNWGEVLYRVMLKGKVKEDTVKYLIK